MRVLVTGVGGGVGQSVIKALQGTGYDVVGVDSAPDAVGLHATGRAYLGLEAKDPRYVDRLLEICSEERCALLFPGHDVELMPIARRAEEFRAVGVIPVVSRPEVISLCDDKLETATYVAQLGLRAPRGAPLSSASDLEPPLVLKPQRGGARSRATYLARDRDELERVLPFVDPDNCLAQEYVDGPEYTCGSVSFDGTCHGVIAMRRVLRDGDTYKAFVESQPAAEAAVRTVVESLRAFGPCNVQLRLHDGQPVIFEINARCSGTTAARALAGFNEPRATADFLLRGVVPRFEIRRLAILRYWQELVVPIGSIEQLEREGSISTDPRTL